MARDPYGVRPLYRMTNSTKNSGLCAMASDIKTLCLLQESMKIGKDDYSVEDFPPGYFAEYELGWGVNSKWILTKEEKYVGCTTVHQVVAMIGNTGGIKEHGAILVLEVNQIDYSLAQIAQIVESNNARILSSYIMSTPDSTKLEVTCAAKTSSR
jgi:hypothetical protein